MKIVKAALIIICMAIVAGLMAQNFYKTISPSTKITVRPFTLIQSDSSRWQCVLIDFVEEKYSEIWYINVDHERVRSDVSTGYGYEPFRNLQVQLKYNLNEWKDEIIAKYEKK